MHPTRARKLRALVYTGLAGGLVGVSTYSAAAHGNASSHCAPLPGQTVSWDADDLVLEDLTPVQDALSDTASALPAADPGASDPGL
jgi:hypothetical protein